MIAATLNSEGFSSNYSRQRVPGKRGTPSLQAASFAHSAIKRVQPPGRNFGRAAIAVREGSLMLRLGLRPQLLKVVHAWVVAVTAVAIAVSAPVAILS